MYQLSLIHEQEVEVGTKCAEVFTLLHGHIEKKGYPKNKEEAKEL